MIKKIIRFIKIIQWFMKYFANGPTFPVSPHPLLPLLLLQLSQMLTVDGIGCAHSSVIIETLFTLFMHMSCLCML